MTDRLTLATSTGLPFFALLFHFGTALVALTAGFLAISVRKGGALHRRAGIAFVYAMVAAGVAAVGIALYEGKTTFTGGATAAYFALTAYLAVKPPSAGRRQVSIALMVLASALAALGFYGGFIALARPRHQLEGVPAGMIFFMSTILLLAAIGDVRMIRVGGLQGARRVARHLWRMSFGLFIASGSFFLGQMKFIPERIRYLPLLFVLALSPLALLLYWMWRVRVKQDLRGFHIAKPNPPAR